MKKALAALLLFTESFIAFSERCPSPVAGCHEHGAYIIVTGAYGKPLFGIQRAVSYTNFYNVLLF